MKKLVLAVFVIALGLSSCKKDEVAQPAAKSSTVMQGEKKDVTGWD